MLSFFRFIMDVSLLRPILRPITRLIVSMIAVPRDKVCIAGEDESVGRAASASDKDNEERK